MSACNAGCGHCGMCSDAWEQPVERDEVTICDRPGCACVIGIGAVSLASLGLFCSRPCANQAEAEFALWMAKKGFMTGTHGER